MPTQLAATERGTRIIEVAAAQRGDSDSLQGSMITYKAPVYPGGQRHSPVMWSQVAPFWHWHLW